MDNLFFNASHTDSAPPAAITRPKHPFKGIDHTATPPPEDSFNGAEMPASHDSTKLAHHLPAPPALQHAAPNQARRILGLPTLPSAESAYPRPLEAVAAARAPEATPTRPDAEPLQEAS